jgi:hypothetical protein
MLCEDSGLIVGLKLGFKVEENHESQKGRSSEELTSLRVKREKCSSSQRKNPASIDSQSQLHGVADRKDDVTRAPFISFWRCRVETKTGRIPPREVLWNLNFGSPVRVTRTFGGLQNH